MRRNARIRSAETNSIATNDMQEKNKKKYHHLIPKLSEGEARNLADRMIQTTIVRTAYCSGPCGRKKKLPIRTEEKCENCPGSYKA